VVRRSAAGGKGDRPPAGQAAHAEASERSERSAVSEKRVKTRARKNTLDEMTVGRTEKPRG